MPQGIIFKDLVVKTTQQVIRKASLLYKELEFQNIEQLPQGNKFINYKDFYQGSSKYNNDVYPTAQTGQSTTPKTGFEDVEISDFNQHSAPVYEENIKCDTSYSHSFTTYSNILNDIALTPALFMAIANDVEYAISNPYKLFLRQRLVDFFSKDWYDQIISYDVPTKWDDATLTSFFYDFKTSLDKLNNTSSRKILTQLPGDAPNTSKQALYYNGVDKTHIIFFDYKLWNNIQILVKAGIFNLSEFGIPSNCEIVPINFDNWNDINPNFKTFINSKFEGDTPLYIIFDKSVYQEILFYSGSKQFNTNKLYDKQYWYLKQGQYRLKDLYLSICGTKKATK